MTLAPNVVNKDMQCLHVQFLIEKTRINIILKGENKLDKFYKFQKVQIQVIKSLD